MVTVTWSHYIAAAMKTSQTTSPIRKAAGLALLLALTCNGAAWAADANSTTSNSTGVTGSASSQNTTNSAAGRDRNDMIRSDQSRINTVGKDADNNVGSKVSRGDRRFIEKAARSGLGEVRMARLAAEKSVDPRVRSFAQQMITDHEKANAELNELAARKGVGLPTDEENHIEHQFKALSDKTGNDFDKRFIGHMTDEHEDDVELFEKASRKSDDPEIAAFASRQLPILQEHHRMAQEIERSLK